MRPINHVIISGGVTAILSMWVKSAGALCACFLSGIFIDLDHHLDYFIAKKEIPFSYKKLVDFCHNYPDAKLYLVLHSYELLIIFWVSIFAFSLGEMWLSIAIGLTTHIICDEVYNPLRPLAYFITFRMKRDFKRELLFKEGYVIKPSS